MKRILSVTIWALFGYLIIYLKKETTANVWGRLWRYNYVHRRMFQYGSIWIWGCSCIPKFSWLIRNIFYPSEQPFFIFDFSLLLYFDSTTYDVQLSSLVFILHWGLRFLRWDSLKSFDYDHYSGIFGFSFDAGKVGTLPLFVHSLAYKGVMLRLFLLTPKMP